MAHVDSYECLCPIFTFQEWKLAVIVNVFTLAITSNIYLSRMEVSSNSECIYPSDNGYLHARCIVV